MYDKAEPFAFIGPGCSIWNAWTCGNRGSHVSGPTGEPRPTPEAGHGGRHA